MESFVDSKEDGEVKLPVIKTYIYYSDVPLSILLDNTNNDGNNKTFLQNKQ